MAGDIFVAADLALRDRSHPSVSDLRRTQGVIDFINGVNEQWDRVLFVAGNHEYYGEDIGQPAPERALRKYCRTSRMEFLNPGYMDIGDVRFVGATLWTDFNGGHPVSMWYAKKQMNDYELIWRDGFKLMPEDTVDFHKAEKHSIAHCVQTAPGKVVVITHHAPSSLSIQDMYKGDTLSPAYYSNQEEFMLDHPQIKVWIHGHTHHNVDYMIGETRVLSNQRGYAGHQKMADSFEVMTIEV